MYLLNFLEDEQGVQYTSICIMVLFLTFVREIVVDDTLTYFDPFSLDVHREVWSSGSYCKSKNLALEWIPASLCQTFLL